MYLQETLIRIMPERALLVIFSVVVVLGALAIVVWVLASGQGLSLDTIFLVLSCLAVALVFALYAKSEIDRVRKKAQSPPPTKPSATGSEG